MRAPLVCESIGFEIHSIQIHLLCQRCTFSPHLTPTAARTFALPGVCTYVPFVPEVYLLALLTEWFQAAYLFVLLREYHPEGFVVRMYLAGVASQLSLSVLLEVVGGFVPHKLRCAACLALQAGSAMLLVHPAFGGLVTSRVLAGFAASLLHSSFEAWMVEQVGTEEGRKGGRKGGRGGGQYLSSFLPWNAVCLQESRRHH